MMAVATAMMVRIRLVGVCRHLVSVAVAMIEGADRCGINARHAFGRMRDSSKPEHKHEHETEEQGGKAVHRPAS